MRTLGLRIIGVWIIIMVALIIKFPEILIPFFSIGVIIIYIFVSKPVYRIKQ